MKTCTKCGESKSLLQFSKKSSSRDGLRHQCKACDRITNAASYASNPEKIKASAAKWIADNPEKHKTYKTKWYTANRENVQMRSSKWAAANSEKRKASIAKWRSSNPEARRIQEHNRRARKRANGGRLSPGIVEKLLNLQRGKCACCHVSIADGNHLDHRIPVALGGPNEDWNMQLLCAPCNLSKGAKHPIEFMQQRGFLL